MKNWIHRAFYTFALSCGSVLLAASASSSSYSLSSGQLTSGGQVLSSSSYSVQPSVIAGSAAGQISSTSYVLTAGSAKPHASTFEQWLVDNNITGDPADDPGGYGIPLLSRYAFGLDPANPDYTFNPVSVTETPFQMSWHLDIPAHVHDIEYVPQYSSDLVNWTDIGTIDSYEMITATGFPSITSNPYFMRVIVRTKQ